MRDNLKETFYNNSRRWQEVRHRKNIHTLQQYATPILNHIREEDYSMLTLVPHVWKTGDRYYKLANDFYGDPTYWWIIAWFNYAPTESHVDVGEIIYIPLSLEQVLLLLEYK